MKSRKKKQQIVILDITSLMWSGLKLMAYGITDSLYSTVNRILLLLIKIYSKENSDNIRKFLEESTRNKNKIAVTSDLDDKYKPIIEGLGFKHQWCLFHVFKNINKKIKDYIRDNELSDDDIDKIRGIKTRFIQLIRQ